MKKKIMMISFVFFFCILLCGCGEQKNVLTCSSQQVQSGLSLIQTIEITFDESSVSKVVSTIDTTATGDSAKEQWSTLIERLEEEYPDVDTEGIHISKKNNEEDYNYKIIYDIDVRKASDEDLEKYDLSGLADFHGTYRDVKEQAEESGLTCE